MEHIIEFLRSMDEPEMADEVANAHNRLECYSTGITNDIIESLRSVAEKSLAELSALKAENESLRKDAERLDWVEHQDFYDLSFAVLVNQPNDGMTAVSIGEGWHLGNNLREAIDAAIASVKGEQ